MRSLTVSVFLVACMLSAAALAQPIGFNGQRFTPAAGGAGGFTVERPEVPDHLDWSVGLFLNYAFEPVVLRDGATGAALTVPLQNALTFDLLGSLSLFHVFELAADLPIDAWYQGAPLVLNGQLVQAAAGVGDLRLIPKIAVLQAPASPVVLSLAAPVTVPTGDSAALRGDGVITVNPELLLGVRTHRFSLALNGGVLIRPGGAALGQELTMGVGVSLALVPRRDVLDLNVESTIGALLSPNVPSTSRVPWEALVGITAKPSPSWQVYVGVGPGILDGVGSAQFRGILGVRYSPRPTPSYSDHDDDGVADTADRCPHEAGPPGQEGCPDRYHGRTHGHEAVNEHTSDHDHDGVPDDVDECPDEPEPYHPGIRDGCPEGEAVYRNGEIVIRGKVQFETGSTALKHKSQRLLDSVAVLLKEHPEVKHVRIEGHTDETGPASTNQELSERRAEVVRQALIHRGISPGRLSARGYGETRPIAPNNTFSGRAKNRRVEFKVAL